MDVFIYRVPSSGPHAKRAYNTTPDGNRDMGWLGLYEPAGPGLVEEGRCTARYLHNFYERMGYQDTFWLAVMKGFTVEWLEVDPTLGTYHVCLRDDWWLGEEYGWRKGVERDGRWTREELLEITRHYRVRPAQLTVLSLDGRQEEINNIINGAS